MSCRLVRVHPDDGPARVLAGNRTARGAHPPGLDLDACGDCWLAVLRWFRGGREAAEVRLLAFSRWHVLPVDELDLILARAAEKPR